MDGSSAGATVYEGFGGSFGRCPTRHEAVSRFTDVIRSGSNRATCPSLEVPCGVPSHDALTNRIASPSC
jgi:hypothetical protein